MEINDFFTLWISIDLWPFLNIMHERVMPETAKITIISANFQVWKYCWKAQFPSCGWFARKLGKITVFFVVRENLPLTYMSEKFIYKLNILRYIGQIQFCRMQGKDIIQKKNKLLTAQTRQAFNIKFFKLLLVSFQYAFLSAK